VEILKECIELREKRKDTGNNDGREKRVFE
jgi:hypothetical protein